MRFLKEQKGAAPLAALLIAALLGAVLLSPQKGNKQPVSAQPSSKPIPAASEASTSATASKAALEKYLTVEAALLGVSDGVSIYFKDESQAVSAEGNDISIDPTRSWIPASTIKSYVVLEAFRQRRQGLLDFNRVVTVKAENVVPTELETDEYPRLRAGTQATLRQLLEAMITQSDNTAYNTLLDILDRRNINLTLRTVGITETVVGEKLNLDDAGLQADLAVPGRQPNTTTAKDLAALFDLLYKKQIPDSEEILAIFKKQKINNMIPALLPPDTVVAHKTGDWAPIFHDGGVIYKPNQDFVLTIFTKDNNPQVLAKLAVVAYFRNAEVVGKDLPFSAPQSFNPAKKGYKYVLAANPDTSKVLAASDQKFPSLTLEDLGVTMRDLSIQSADAAKITPAVLLPGSLLYDLKRAFENFQSQFAKSHDQRIDNNLAVSSNRLAELKAALRKSDLESAKAILKESETNLKSAADQSKVVKTVDGKLVKIRQVNDLHFAVLAQEAKYIKPSQKEEFINMVYDFYKKDASEVKPVVKSSVAANPLQQQPVMGTIQEVRADSVVLKFDNGEEKTVTVNDYTPVRAFQQDKLDSKGSLKKGSRIVIIGQSGDDGRISPQFILRDIPKDLPAKKEGVVLEVDPQNRVLKIKNQSGNNENIQINSSTVIKGKDTGVTLEGIKAGSTVTVFGQNEQAVVPTPAASPLKSQVKPSSNAPQNALQKPETVLKAVTVTVTQNSPGTQEKKEESKPQPKKEEKPSPPKQQHKENKK